MKCYVCGHAEMKIFYKMRSVPTHSVLLMPSRDTAVNHPKRDITLGFCRQCGFVENTSFDPATQKYSENYESTQTYSEIFNAFLRELSKKMVDRHNLHHKTIIEIGCGNGEFLDLICQFGPNRGFGFDPSCRREDKDSGAVRFIKEVYSEKYSNIQADFICCRMTLEHIYRPAGFLNMLRNSIGSRSPVLLFQVPDVIRILREVAFWDIYYEHCSYFSHESLAGLFQRCGFHVVDRWKDYSDQYLFVEVRPGAEKVAAPLLTAEEDLDELAQYVAYFSKESPRRIDMWRTEIGKMKSRGDTVAIWGGGSKGVAFLTTLDIQDEVEYVIDINPKKQGTFMAGTGHKIVSPEFMKKVTPDVIIAMNPVYIQEITSRMAIMDITARLLSVNEM
jgi:SAM-dependent methyltransferase